MCIQSDQGGRPVKITVETVVKADSSAVWRAWNNPEDIKQWNAASDDGTRPRALGARPPLQVLPILEADVCRSRRFRDEAGKVRFGSA